MTFQCVQCGKEKPVSYLVHTMIGDRSIALCARCFGSRFPGAHVGRCDDCLEFWDSRLLKNAAIISEPDVIMVKTCPSCVRRKYVRCSGCNEIVLKTQSGMHDGTVYCNVCMEAISLGFPLVECPECGTRYVMFINSDGHSCPACEGRGNDDIDIDQRHATISFKKNEENDEIVNDPRSEM